MEINTDITSGAYPEAAVFAFIKARQAQTATRGPLGQTDGTSTKGPDQAAHSSKTSTELNDAEQRVVDQLRSRDREVRDHEQAHKRVGGPYASAPTYTYQIGPDGRRYAIGGQVLIDASPVPEDPEATIAKMLIVKAAALTPAEPSSADRNVAAAADAQISHAEAELTAMRSAELRGETLDRFL